MEGPLTQLGKVSERRKPHINYKYKFGVPAPLHQVNSYIYNSEAQARGLDKKHEFGSHLAWMVFW